MKSTLKTYIDAPPRTRIAKMRKGAGFMMVAVITALMVALTSMGVTKINQASLGGLNSSRAMLQAQQYAEAEAAVVKATSYSDLTARNKSEIQNSNGYYSQVTLSNESDYAENIKQKIATIKIYKDGEALPRYTLNVLKTNAEVQSSGGGVPVGTIIAWASTTAPTEGGTWLLCNGGTFSSSNYPQLYTVLGKTTLPSLNGRFLEGTTSTPGSTKEAGLPNIGGDVYVGKQGNAYPDGFGDNISVGNQYSYPRVTKIFKASDYSSIYGASSTVQPKSYLVRYYIKAK